MEIKYSLNKNFILYTSLILIYLLIQDKRPELCASVLLFICVYVFSEENRFEHFVNMINNQEEKPFFYKYDKIQVDEYANTIVFLSRYYPDIKKYINETMITIYNEIKTNDRFRNFLLFNNLINSEGMPLFINESEEVLLFNQVKIILIFLGYTYY